MSSFASETRLAYTLLLKGGVVIRSIGDALCYLDSCPEGIERSAIRVMLQQAHWYGHNIETATRRLFGYLEGEGLVYKHGPTHRPIRLP